MDWKIENKNGHYVIYKDGIFYCSADTKSEANDAIFEGSKGCGNCAHTFRGAMCTRCSRNIHNRLATGSCVDNWRSWWSIESVGDKPAGTGGRI